MHKSVIKASTTYIDTLHSLGAIHPKEVYALLMIGFLDTYIDKFDLDATEIEEVNKVLDCIRKRSCLGKHVEDFLNR